MNTTTKSKLDVKPKRLAKTVAAIVAMTMAAGSLLLAPVAATAASEPNVEFTDPNNPSVKYQVPNSIEPGQDIVISGTGWLNAAKDNGSVITVMLDALVSGDPNTVRTKRQLTNPIDGSLIWDNRFHAVVKADESGNWTAIIPFPTAENSSAGDPNFSPRGGTPEWTVGTSHSIRFLTGSMLPGDVARTLSAQFVIAERPVLGPPSWNHVTVNHESGAVAWVQQDIDVTGDATMKIRGRGWSNPDAASGSTVAIKLNYGDGRQYTRNGAGIVQHPSASGDDTIWALLAPENTAAHPNVFEIDDNGEFEIELKLPDTLSAGQELSVLFQSGRFASGDVLRSVTSDNLIVGGVPFVPETGSEQATCMPSVPAPTVSFANPNAELGGVLEVIGQGWCHPAPNRGGSVIAIKIDEGAFEHLDASLHTNRTIWAIVEADEHTGDWRLEMPLPDGTTASSLPAFTEGSHSLRLLSGSLKDGDAGRSLKSGEFVVGPYRPNGPAEPVEASESLTAATRGALSASLSGSSLSVTVPKAKRGEWIYLNAFDGNTPTFLFGDTWVQADLNGQVKIPFDTTKVSAKTLRISAQSGNQDRKNELLGWTELRLAATGPVKPTPAPSKPQAPVIKPKAQAVAQPAQSITSQQQPTIAPQAPVNRASALGAISNGGITQTVNGTVATIKVPLARESEWVYLFTYTGARQADVGWVQLKQNGAFDIDLAALGEGRHRVVVVAADDTVLGWSETNIGETALNAAATSEDPEAITTEITEKEITEIVPISAPEPSGNNLEMWLLIAAGAVIIAGATVVVVIVVRGKRKA